MVLSLCKNQDIQLHIDGVTSEGSGVGRFDGMAVFVAGAAAGDTVTAHIIKVKKTYAVGIVKDIVVPSPDRTDIDCPSFRSCGGCSFRHISYEAEKRIKSGWVRDAFLRIAHMDVPVRGIITANELRYRNKAQYPVGFNNGIVAGFYAQKSRRIINSAGCALHPTEFSDIVETVKNWMTEYKIPPYDAVSGRGLVRHIYIRKGFATGEIMVCLVANGLRLPHSDELCERLFQIDGVKSIILNENREKTNVIMGKKCITLGGADYIEDILCGVRIRISPLSFYQVNRDAAELLYKKAAEYAALSGGETVFDLYCGAGTIGLSMAERAKKVIGVEIVPEAIEDAKKNAEINGISNCEFYCMDAGAAAGLFKEKNIQPDVIILDPPRKGCGGDVLKYAAQMAPEKIIYVSCNASTLARDCAILNELGYAAREVTPVDMFPRTHHVECVALLLKKEQTKRS